MVLRRHLPRLLLAGAGVVVTASAYRLWSLVITNLYVPGSLAWSHPLAPPLTLLLAGITALPYAVVAYRLRSASSKRRLLFAVLVAVCAWIIYPVVCDTQESFLDRPNRRCSCAGATVHWYPRDVFDYSNVEYCIGVELPPNSRP